jgi:hypothetical protein
MDAPWLRADLDDQEEMTESADSLSMRAAKQGVANELVRVPNCFVP